MKKAIQFGIKIAAVLAAIGAVACLVVAYWDTLTEMFYAVAGKLEQKKEQLCGYGAPSEYDDYDDGALK